jgi:hypothetical protein
VVGDSWGALADSPDVLPASASGVIEIVIGAVMVRMPLAVDGASLRRVLGVVRSLA